MMSERTYRVLRAVVQSYISTPSPVGSRFVTRKYDFRLSPATIRNIMSDLEELGFLSQPHTSAGRVPTEKGYRFYVDSLFHDGFDLYDGYLEIFEKGLLALRSDVNALLEEAARTLSSLSHCLAFAVPFKHGKTTLNRIQLYRYRGGQTVVVLLTDEGLVKNKVLDTDFGLTQREFNRISDYINSEFSGLTMEEIRVGIAKRISKEKALCDILISRALAVCKEAFSFRGELIISGFSELVGLPELSGRINEIAKAIEDKQTVLRLLERLAVPAEGVRVVIGDENPVEPMRNLSVIVAHYRQKSGLSGSVGMIGPMRMDYAKAIPLVGTMARFISGSI